MSNYFESLIDEEPLTLSGIPPESNPESSDAQPDEGHFGSGFGGGNQGTIAAYQETVANNNNMGTNDKIFPFTKFVN